MTRKPASIDGGRPLSRRRMLGACVGLLAITPELARCSPTQSAKSCAFMLGPFGQERVPGFIGAKADDFIEPKGYRFFPRDRFAEEPAFRIGLMFDFRGYEAKRPLRRRVRLDLALLDSNSRPLVTVNKQFLDRRAVARESLNDRATLRRGGIASTLDVSYGFQLRFLALLNLVELRFTELSPAATLADDPFA